MNTINLEIKPKIKPKIKLQFYCRLAVLKHNFGSYDIEMFTYSTAGFSTLTIDWDQISNSIKNFVRWATDPIIIEIEE